MLVPFLLALFVTFIVVRIHAYMGHDMENYGTDKERSKTFTGLLRKLTGFDIHHIHIGIVILLITIFVILLSGFGNVSAVFLGIGISMTVDQWFPLIFRKKNYFHKDCFLVSLVGHLIVGLIAVLIYVNY